MSKELNDGISRRKFMQAGSMLAASTVISLNTEAKNIDASVQPSNTREGIDYIDPLIGNIAPLLNTNRPVVHMPNQMVRTFPRRQDYTDDQITGCLLYTSPSPRDS